jgi:membrane protein DedA with SNARE-associated domain
MLRDCAGRVAAFPVLCAVAVVAMAAGLEHGIAAHLEAVTPILERYGYAAVFVAVFVEGVGIPAPGETLLVAGGIDAARGGLHIGALVVTAFLAAWLGNAAGYVIGRMAGRRLLARFPRQSERFARVEGLFADYGGWIILVARFVDGLRQLNGYAAGILSMPARTFVVWNTLGAALWVAVCCWGSYAATEHIHALLHLLHGPTPWLVAFALAALAALAWRRARRP